MAIENYSARFVRSCLAVACLVPALAAYAQRAQSIAIIPAPAKVTILSGEFIVHPGIRVEFAPAGEAGRIATYFTSKLARLRGLELTPALAPPAASRASLSPAPVAAPAVSTAGTIRFELLAVEGETNGEGYSLTTSPQRIVVSARHPRGLFYGAVTLLQLLTAESGRAESIAIPSLAIEDEPRFQWRGLMLDVARHYAPPQFIEQLLDQMALHKLNTFHWHLTDDQGWRIEIRKYPRLTGIGAWRTPAGAAGTDAQGRALRIGGYYTQDEVRAIVRYAAERFITVVPEIEMPGHAQAAIAAYPELGVDGVAPPVSADWGVHTQLFNVEESTFAFLENVLAEVVELFPGRYLHVGGDEAAKDRWESSPRVQARMRELGVGSQMQLQSYFIRRIEKFLNAHDRSLIGWDEILEGGLAPNATVMSWRGASGAVEAARQKHDVVMAAHPVLYFDHLQSDAADEPPGRPNLVTLEDVYAFEPVPPEMTAADARHVLGAQANVWTEHMRTTKRVEHAVFPRIAALAEITWSPREGRNFDEFLERLRPQLGRYQAQGLHFARSALTPRTVAAPANAPSLRKRDEELRTCNARLPLHLEDDSPVGGRRPVFLVDIMDPCWIYASAPLDGVRAVAVTVGQIPYNFQLWKDAKNVVTRAATTEDGALEIRLDGCDGELMARMPLTPARSNPDLTVLRAELPPVAGLHDLCITFATGGVEPLWVIDTVELTRR